jgi:hypothetical protein
MCPQRFDTDSYDPEKLRMLQQVLEVVRMPLAIPTREAGIPVFSR